MAQVSSPVGVAMVSRIISQAALTRLINILDRGKNALGINTLPAARQFLIDFLAGGTKHNKILISSYHNNESNVPLVVMSLTDIDLELASLLLDAVRETNGGLVTKEILIRLLTSQAVSTP